MKLSLTCEGITMEEGLYMAFLLALHLDDLRGEYMNVL